MFGKKQKPKKGVDPDTTTDIDEASAAETATGSDAGPIESGSTAGGPTPGTAGTDGDVSETGSGAGGATGGEDWHGRYLRSLAEFDNFRKRMDREREQSRRYALEGVMTDLLGVLDALQAASDTQGDLESIRQGIQLAGQELLRVLKDKGLDPIETEEGMPFDPRLHEAMAMIPTNETGPGMILREVTRGYRLHERVLRASRVHVAAAPPAAVSEDDAADSADGAGSTERGN